MRILLAGGGSGGPVAPMLAVAETIKKHHPNSEFLLVGTQNGPERQMAESSDINFEHISPPKLRRYFSWKNFSIPFLLPLSFFQSLKILSGFKPDCIFGTGSFVQVPIVWAAWFKRIPVVLHQQDIVPSLANKLCQLAAKKITVTFEANLTSFYTNFGIFYKRRRTQKIVLTGNPFRQELKSGSKNEANKKFNLNSNLPTLLVLGGGTGADFLNKLIWDGLFTLTKTVQIIHSTGAGKFQEQTNENYHPYEFISDMSNAYAAADIVLCRAGISTITELSNLKKISIIVPMPESHQEINGYYLKEAQAAVVLEQSKVTLSGFVSFIRKFIFAHEVGETLKENISKIMEHDSNQKIADIIIKLALKQ
jgi:UDP-N-acetylglucosamine--N-acetylmuramyl-(pentapeptide) pyrophosphoryl-undecaprenol N-acetylglucosamine transferase